MRTAALQETTILRSLPTIAEEFFPLPMNVVIADQNLLSQERLKRRLEKIKGVVVVGSTADAAETTAVIVNRKPDIVILETDLKN